MAQEVFKSVFSGQIKHFGGFLGARFLANKENRLKKWMMVEGFIAPYEQKNYDDWFWKGEQIGKWLDAAAYSCLIGDDQELRDVITNLLKRLAASQEKDGYLGITHRFHRNPVRGMQLYEWYYVLHGLLACYDVLNSELALTIAVRLGDYIINTWGVEADQFPLWGRFPGTGHMGGEGTLILGPIVLLGTRAHDDRFVKWGEKTLSMWDRWSEEYPENFSTASLKSIDAVAKSQSNIHELRENIHAHALHMNLLGLAALYEATGKEEYRDLVLGCIDNIAKKYVFLTGGMSSNERYVPFHYYHARNDIEVCPQHSWVLLLDHALRWTGKAKYAEEIERTLLNNLLAAQLADGSNWSYMTPLNGQALRPSTPNCCNASGSRIIGRIPTFIYGQNKDNIVIHQYTESEVEFSVRNRVTVKLAQKTRYPSSGSIALKVQVDRPTTFKLSLRIPSFARDTRIEINGIEHGGVNPATYTILDREWKNGDTVVLEIPMRVKARMGKRKLALTRGPLVYTYFQTWQDNSVSFPGRGYSENRGLNPGDQLFTEIQKVYPESQMVHFESQGLYPDDVELLIDPKKLEYEYHETSAPEGCLGPALRVRARQKPVAPLFANPDANKELRGVAEVSALLLPFVNQGTRNGHYATFIDYERV